MNPVRAELVGLLKALNEPDPTVPPLPLLPEVMMSQETTGTDPCG